MVSVRVRANAWVALCALGLWAAAVRPAPAQEGSPVHVTVRGVTGPVLRGKPRSFVAVNVVLEHLSRADADADGVVRVYRTHKPQQETPDQSLFYEQRVSLPPGARRVVTLYYYCQENEPDDRLAVAFVPDEGSAPAPTYPQLKLDRNSIRVLAISSQPVDGPVSALRDAVVSGHGQALGTVIEVADRKDLSTLPDHMVGYDAFDCVFVTDLDPDALPDQRAQALLDWVAAGGDLIVGFSGRQGDLDRSPLAKTLPVFTLPEGRDTVERQVMAIRKLARPMRGPPRADRVAVDHVGVAKGAEVLAGDADGPLVVRGRFGAGTVTYVTFPLDSPPLRRWSGKSDLGSALLRPPRVQVHDTEQPTRAPPLNEVLLNLSEALETLTPPSALLVAPLLLLYVALVSPINYKVFAKRRKLILTQATAGALALGFGGLFYGIGRVYKGSESLSTQVAVVELAVSPGKSRIDVMTGFFSTDQGLSGGRAHPLAMIGPIADQKTSREGRVVQGGDGATLESVTLDTWALRRFRSIRAEDIGFLDADLTMSGNAISGTLDNRSKLTLTNPLLITEYGCFDLGTDLNASSRLRFDGNRITPHGKLNPSALGFVDAVYQDAGRNYPARYGQQLAMNLGGNPYGSAHGRILATFRHRLQRLVTSPESMPAVLVGVAVRDPAGVLLDAQTSPKLQRMLVVAELRLATDGIQRLSGLEPRVELYNGSFLPISGSTGSPPMLQSSMGGNPGVVEWSWRVPASEERPFQPAHLELRWTVDPNPAPQFAKLEGYNVQLGKWVTLTDPGELQYRLEDNRYWPQPGSNHDPRHYVDPTTGYVRVRYVNGGGETLLTRMHLQIDGRY